ncbi:sensor histidine kinase [Herbaspirillum sp. RV1423]|uniref:sensor histidine kinase n=1 Tax=Herbaspirillum sp. RV1423 TaxID=1443993 RepID=UPI0004BAECA6|nr:ATP-binding protein [Herbaspirillum sp. RV1423]
MQSPTLLSILAALPVLLMPAGIGAVAGAPPYINYANKIFWLSALLLLCHLPFIFDGSTHDLSKLFPAYVVIAVLYLLYIAEKEKLAGVVNSQLDVSSAFTELANRMDGEDSRLCASLHDELNPCLIFAKRKMEECLTLAQGQNNIATILNRSMLEIDRAYSVSRAIIKKVHVEIVESIGLITALEDLISHYDEISPLHPKLQHNLTRKIEQSIDRTRSITIYRIIREALLNAIKHSRATNLLISMNAQSRQHMLYISILDDGKGIAERFTPGVGLIDMRIRAMQAGGTLSIQKGEDNCGTLIELSIPLS